MDSTAGRTLPSARRAGLLLWRAARLRCPHCGARGALSSWFRLRERCPRCGLRLERGEHDYFLGGMMFNIVLAEGLFAVALILVMLVTWPAVPWDVLEVAAPLLMLAAPLLLYPFSKLAWLAFDLVLRPASERELRWDDRRDGPPAR